MYMNDCERDDGGWDCRAGRLEDDDGNDGVRLLCRRDIAGDRRCEPRDRRWDFLATTDSALCCVCRAATGHVRLMLCLRRGGDGSTAETGNGVVA